MSLKDAADRNGVVSSGVLDLTNSIIYLLLERKLLHISATPCWNENYSTKTTPLLERKLLHILRGLAVGAWCFGLMTCVRPTVDQWSCSGPAQFRTADVDQARPSAADGHLPKLLDPP